METLKAIKSRLVFKRRMRRASAVLFVVLLTLIFWELKSIHQDDRPDLSRGEWMVEHQGEMRPLIQPIVAPLQKGPEDFKDAFPEINR